MTDGDVELINEHAAGIRVAKPAADAKHEPGDAVGGDLLIDGKLDCLVLGSFSRQDHVVVTPDHYPCADAAGRHSEQFADREDGAGEVGPLLPLVLEPNFDSGL